MKVELYKILSSYRVLNPLFKEKLKGSLAFKVLGLLKEVENETRKFEEVKAKLISDNKLEVDEQGIAIIEDEGLKAKINDELLEISNSIVNINARPFSLEDLDKLDLTPEQVMLIEWAIENGDNS